MTRLLKKVTGSASDEDDDEVEDQVAGSPSDEDDDEKATDQVVASAGDENDDEKVTDQVVARQAMRTMTSRWWIRLQLRQVM